MLDVVCTPPFVCCSVELLKTILCELTRSGIDAFVISAVSGADASD